MLESDKRLTMEEHNQGSARGSEKGAEGEKDGGGEKADHSDGEKDGPKARSCLSVLGKKQVQSRDVIVLGSFRVFCHRLF